MIATSVSDHALATTGSLLSMDVIMEERKFLTKTSTGIWRLATIPWIVWLIAT